MSAETKTAIYSVLASDSELTDLLAADENDDPAIFNSNMNKLAIDRKLEEVPLPCVTYREGPGSADSRFRQETVDAETFDLEAWAKTESGLVVPAIGARIDALLHNQVLTLSSGTNYDCVRISQTPDLYDDKLNLHFGLYRYRLIVSRN